jgi:hypothetical protein
MGETKVKITADTNVLIGAVVQDDPHQAHQATKTLREAERPNLDEELFKGDPKVYGAGGPVCAVRATKFSLPIAA